MTAGAIRRKQRLRHWHPSEPSSILAPVESSSSAFPDEYRLATGESTRASRVLARERQKQEIRRERDQMLIAIARDLGADDFARQLGTDAAVTHALLDNARRRLADAEARNAVSEIRASRRRLPDHDRWAEADRQYEALGRSPRPVRRFTRSD
jgi:hypothetical protein